MKKYLVALLVLSGCASLEERLCNPTKAFQKGYEDVTEGRANTPGLAEGEACKKSENYAYENYYRDYMAGFEKGKSVQCTRDTAERLGSTDADSGKAFRTSLPKLQVCLNDSKAKKTGLKSFYEISYRKAFCSDAKMATLAAQDAQDLKNKMRDEGDFALCAYQSRNLFKSYQKAYAEAMRKQCTAARLSGIAVQHARAKKPMSEGYALIDNCPSDLQAMLTQSYTATYQNERDQMNREELVDLERQRLQQQNDNDRRLIELRQQELQFQINNPTAR